MGRLSYDVEKIGKNAFPSQILLNILVSADRITELGCCVVVVFGRKVSKYSIKEVLSVVHEPCWLILACARPFEDVRNIWTLELAF